MFPAQNEYQGEPYDEAKRPLTIQWTLMESLSTKDRDSLAKSCKRMLLKCRGTVQATRVGGWEPLCIKWTFKEPLKNLAFLSVHQIPSSVWQVPGTKKKIIRHGLQFVIHTYSFHTYALRRKVLEGVFKCSLDHYGCSGFQREILLWTFSEHLGTLRVEPYSR